MFSNELDEQQQSIGLYKQEYPGKSFKWILNFEPELGNFSIKISHSIIKFPYDIYNCKILDDDLAMISSLLDL